MTDLKVLDTRGLLKLMYDEQCLSIPDEIMARLDAAGKHVFQRHSLYNKDPNDPIVHARSMFKTYDRVSADDFPITVVDIPRQRWDDLPDWFG